MKGKAEVRNFLLLPSYFLLVVFTPALPLWAAGFGAGSKGTTGAAFLKIAPGARAVGMGEAFTALANDATALYWNPACLMRIQRASLTFMHAKYLEQTFFDHVAWGGNLGSDRAMGMGIQYFSSGGLTQADDLGNTFGSFHPHDLALTFGYARQVRGFSLGVGAKYIESEIIDKATAFAADVGILTSPLFQKKVQLGFMAGNIGTSLKYDQVNEQLPLVFKAGAAIGVRADWDLGWDVVVPRDNNPYTALGSEYRLNLAKDTGLALRGGLNGRTLNDADGLNVLSIGLGFSYRLLELDYASVPFGSAGITQKFSFSLRL